MAGPGLEFVGDEECALVMQALRARQLNRYRFGQHAAQSSSLVATFEGEFSQYLGVPKTLATNSCTSALVAGLTALKLGPRDEVLVPAFTFVASAAAVWHAGATPVFCDIDETLAISVDSLRKAISENTKAIIVVHMLGRPCDMEALQGVADARRLTLIEDVAQACGGSFRGRPLGSFGRFGCFSFNVFKTITCGEGGALCTADEELYQEAFAFHDHGFRPSGTRVIDSGARVGMNLRMTDLSGAVVLAQLRKLPAIVARLRSMKRAILDGLRLPPFVTVNDAADPAGEVATSLVLRFDSAALAAEFCRLLKTKPVLNSGWHFCRNMQGLVGLVRKERGVDPLRHVSAASDEILERNVLIGIGMLDHYLAAGLGVSAAGGPEQLEQLIVSVNDSLKKLLERKRAKG